MPWISVIWDHTNRGQDKQPELTDWYGWDTHNDIFDALKIHLLPRFDQSFSALLEDLHQRGLLDSTLVVCMGEFGRAPLVALEKTFAGATPGRKHWAGVYSIVLAGAGVAGGGVVGSSDGPTLYPSTNAGRSRGTWRRRCSMRSASRRTAITPIQRTGRSLSQEENPSLHCTLNEPAMNVLPETILQFGAGRFLRAFADLFIHQANQTTTVGKVVIVQSTE